MTNKVLGTIGNNSNMSELQIAFRCYFVWTCVKYVCEYKGTWHILSLVTTHAYQFTILYWMGILFCGQIYRCSRVGHLVVLHSMTFSDIKPSPSTL